MQSEKKKALLEKAYRLGFEYEKKYGGCSQTTVAAIQDTLGLPNDDVFKAATGLAAGGGSSGIGSCGGYVGGVMVLSLLCGRERANFDDPGRQVRMKSFNIAKKLLDLFMQEFGSIHCRDIQMKIFGRPYYIRDVDEFTKFEEAGGHRDKCTNVVGKAAQMAVKVALDEGLLDGFNGST